MSALAPTLQAFFTDRLLHQRQASPHTVAAYRDTLRLLLRFATEQLSVELSKLDIDHLDAPLIGEQFASPALVTLEPDEQVVHRLVARAQCACIHPILETSESFQREEHVRTLARSCLMPQ